VHAGVLDRAGSAAHSRSRTPSYGLPLSERRRHPPIEAFAARYPACNSSPVSPAHSAPIGFNLSLRLQFFRITLADLQESLECL
jgi:hypothetical protein